MEDRKKSHIDLAFQSQTGRAVLDERFVYEPMLSAHPAKLLQDFTFLGKTFKVPMWVSSMTGGTQKAGVINRNLARVCKDFGMGMGLGSCRILLESEAAFSDFDLRDVIGEEQAFYANIGISQLEQLQNLGQAMKIHSLVDRLRADGLIIHVNPLQEWVQAEGDRLYQSPLDTIKRFLDNSPYKVIVKEVGQGMGKESLKALLALPLEAVETASFGGTNFSLLEVLRRDEANKDALQAFSAIGETAETMIDSVCDILKEGSQYECKQLIISGGIRNFLDGYYLMERSPLPSIYGQASNFLRYAQKSYEELHAYVESQVKALRMAQAFLRIKEE